MCGCIVKYWYSRRAGRVTVGRGFLVGALTLLPVICFGQAFEENVTRTVERFTFSFEATELVEIQLTANKPAEEIQIDEFLTLEFFDGRRLVLAAEFNLAQLPLITISADTTGYGKATLNVNGLRSHLVPVRRDRIYLQARVFVSTIVRDYESDDLILLPTDMSLKGLMTFVNKDGGRRSRTIVTTSMKVDVSD